MSAFWLGCKLEEVIEIDRADKLSLRSLITVFYRVTRRSEGRSLKPMDPYSKVRGVVGWVGGSGQVRCVCEGAWGCVSWGRLAERSPATCPAPSTKSQGNGPTVRSPLLGSAAGV